MISVRDLKERYAKDPLPIRWGGIASDLVRISSMAHAEKIRSAAFDHVLTETKLFSEWLAVGVASESQETLLELQRALSGWTFEPPGPRELENEAKRWADRILEVSGLANRD